MLLMKPLPKPSAFFSDPVYKMIESRLAQFSPKFRLADHVDFTGKAPSAGGSSLVGINFRPKDHKKLIEELTNLQFGGLPVFAKGSRDDPSHWALSLSFKETNGIGFREIFRFKLPERPLMPEPTAADRREQRLIDRHAAWFGDIPKMPDITSLHCAVAEEICNIHIDETGFVIETLDGPALTIDAARHWAIELKIRTELRNKFLDNPKALWLIDHIEPIVPSVANDLTIGMKFEPIKTSKYRLTVMGACALHGQGGCAGTVSAAAVF